MNNELITRIDDELSTPMMPEPVRRLLRDCKSEIERLSKPYVPMTIFECYDVAASYNAESEHLSLVAHIEAAVIARYNEQRGVK